MEKLGASSFETIQSDIYDVSTNDTDIQSYQDIIDFRADVFGSEKDESFASKIINDFSAYSEDLAVKKVDFEASLDKASVTGNPEDILAATRAMGDYQLQVLLTTKVASKTSSSIEKLTNLQ